MNNNTTGADDTVMTNDSPQGSFVSSSSDAMSLDSTSPTTSDEHHGAATQSLPGGYTNDRRLCLSFNRFNRFKELPSHLRKHIWSLASPAPRTRFLEIYHYDTSTFTSKIRYIPNLPALFHACQESRRVSIEHEGGALVHFNASPYSFARKATDARFYFNFDRDIVFLSSRFLPTSSTTETYRLRDLASILPTALIPRVRRLLITYSGLDSYECIGPLFRPFAGLEVVYIGMMDWWSHKTTMRMLRKNIPASGTVAAKISRVLADTEAEETDDDEETNEELQTRISARARRRIVEVETRLDEG
ncbi:hypothetical protein ACN47E_003178 [Coniothyrium glycines]